MIDATAIRLRYEALKPVLDERGLRRFAAAEARAAGRGGIAVVSKITGIARSTIGRGLAEMRGETAAAVPAGRVRRAGTALSIWRKNFRNSFARWRGMQSPMTLLDFTSSAAKSVVVPWRL